MRLLDRVSLRFERVCSIKEGDGGPGAMADGCSLKLTDLQMRFDAVNVELWLGLLQNLD